MQVDTASLYRRLAQECIDMAARASHPNNRETLERFAAIWLRLAADELDEASKEAKRERARSGYLENIQQE